MAEPNGASTDRSDSSVTGVFATWACDLPLTKVLQLADELRAEFATLRGAPSKDAEVAELAKPADAEAILHAIKKLEDER